MFLGLFLILGQGLFVVSHEFVHVEINRHYGIESEIDWFDISEGGQWWEIVATTTRDKPCPVEECRLAHNINEAISYPLSIVFTVFSVFFYFITLILLGILDKMYEDVEASE